LDALVNAASAHYLVVLVLVVLTLSAGIAWLLADMADRKRWAGLAIFVILATWSIYVIGSAGPR